jgi:MinD superfamily P-loop ATPase
VGCGACAPVCPTDAIWGEKRQPFSIVPELCENCGACVLSCPPAYAAIYMKSGDAEQKLPQKRRKSA